MAEQVEHLRKVCTYTIDYRLNKSSKCLILLACFKTLHLSGIYHSWLLAKQVEHMLHRAFVPITFWAQNHPWLSSKQVEQMLDIIGVFEKEIDLGSCKNHRLWSGIVDKMIEYALFERKKNLSRCGTFWDQNHNWYRTKKRKNNMLDVISAFWEKRALGVPRWSFSWWSQCWNYVHPLEFGSRDLGSPISTS